MQALEGCTGCTYKIIVVDDGSTDNTPSICEDMAEHYGPSVFATIRHNPNRGYGGALRTGIQAGVETGYDLVAFCDSDRQFDPADVVRFVETALEGADIVIGYRISRADNLKRRLMGRGWHWLGRAVLGYRAIDVDCGFKLFTREALLRFPALRGDHATISPEILYCARRLGLSIREIGVNHFPRGHGTQSGANLRVIAASLVGLLQLRLAHRASFLKGL